MNRLPVIIEARRTPLSPSGRGSLRGCPAEEILGSLINSMLDASAIAPSEVRELFVASAMGRDCSAPGLARASALVSRLQDSSSGRDVCDSDVAGLDVITMAQAVVESQKCDCLLAGACESRRQSWKEGPRRIHPQVLARMPDLALGPGILAEELADEYRITRLMQERYAEDSHKRATEAMAKGFFSGQIAPLKWREKRLTEKGLTDLDLSLSADENPREDIAPGMMAGLPPIFREGGTVTAATSAARSDGAALLLVMAGSLAAERGIKPLGRLQGRSMRAGPPGRAVWNQAEAVRDVLKWNGLSLEDVSCLQVAEAFAVSPLALIKELNIQPERVNPSGGCLALGYASTAAGAVMAVMLLHELRRRSERFGVVSMASPDGVASAALFESFAP